MRNTLIEHTKLRRAFYLAALAFAFAPDGAGAQYPGEKDFSNLNGPVRNSDPSGNVPVVDYRFNTPAYPLWGFDTPKSQLPPAQYNQCKQDQYDFPTRDISCR